MEEMVRKGRALPGDSWPLSSLPLSRSGPLSEQEGEPWAASS